LVSAFYFKSLFAPLSSCLRPGRLRPGPRVAYSGFNPLGLFTGPRLLLVGGACCGRFKAWLPLGAAMGWGYVGLA